MDRLLLKMYKEILKDIEMELMKAMEYSETKAYQDLYATGNDIAQMIDDLENKINGYKYALPKGAERR